MFNGYLVTSVILAISFILIGVLTLSRNPLSRINRYFMLFSSSLAVWLIANYLAGTSKTSEQLALVANWLTFIFNGLGVLSALLFVKNLTGEPLSKKGKYLVIVSLIFILLGGSPLVVSSVKAEGSTYLISFGPLAPVYFLAVIGNAVAAIRALFRGRKHAVGSLKAQIYVIQTSFAVGLSAILITNTGLPLLFGVYHLTTIGSFFSLLFVVGIAYAIVRHKLFDIRLIVARSLGYIFSLGFITAVFSILIFGFSGAVIDSHFSRIVKQLFYVSVTLGLVLTYPYLKQFFDKITNKFFYQDAYEPQVLLDEFNKTLVSEIQLDKLLKKVSTIIQTYLKAEYVVVGVQKTNDTKRHVEGSVHKQYDEADLNELIDISPSLPFVVIATDYLDEEYADLKALLNKNDIALVARLVNTSPDGDPDIGYIILGQKKSGNIYNKQDITIMEILANEMVLAVQNALRFEEIQQFNKTLQQKVNDATRQLRRTNEKLVALDKSKDDFISMASHQLRTPLTSVKGYISMVLDGDGGKVSTKQVQLLGQAFISSQRMVYLIADLLNVSRLRAGKLVIESQPTQLDSVVLGEIDQLIQTAKSRGVTLIYDRPKDFPILNLDETKIRQVIMNFADNAIYYTPSGGNIVLSLKNLDKSIEFTVTDTGIGVPRTVQHHLFTKFYRAANAQKARPDGTGLGLFMAKKVIVAQGGAVIFNSKENVGSTFGFTFPKNRHFLINNQQIHHD